MGFLDILGTILYSISDYTKSEKFQKRVEQNMDRAERRAEQAERAYDAGKISLEQYSNVVDDYTKTANGYMNYRKSLDKANNQNNK